MSKKEHTATQAASIIVHVVLVSFSKVPLSSGSKTQKTQENTQDKHRFCCVFYQNLGNSNLVRDQESTYKRGKDTSNNLISDALVS